MNDPVALQPPPGWHKTSLEAVASRISNGLTKPQTKDGNGFPVSRIETISNGVIDFSRVGYLRNLSAEEAKRFRLYPGDILFSHINSDAHLGKTAVFPNAGVLLHGMNLLLIRVDLELIQPIYLHWLLTYYRRFGFFTSIAQHAVNQSSINQAKLKSVPIFLPPVSEQHRIVSKIEELFSELDKGIENLKQARAQLTVYRQALLKHAFEGNLTADWRKANADKLEPADQLLARILDERRQTWQGRGNYKEPAAPNTTNLPKLPESWSWVSWGMVLACEDGAFKRGPFGSALTKSIFVEKGFKVYEQYCPINDDCSFARYYITPEKFEELKAFEVKAGDYLISCSGVTLGRITRVPEAFERGIINQALLRVRINDAAINHLYFLHLFRSALFQKAIFANSTGSAIPNIKGVKEIKAMAIPLPPLAEQSQIVAEVDYILSVTARLESDIDTNLQKAEALRQSILKKAFAGELVPQDPNDEPASELLARIRTERTANSNGKTAAALREGESKIAHGFNRGKTHPNPIASDCDDHASTGSTLCG